jgi:hypothetical protein
MAVRGAVAVPACLLRREAEEDRGDADHDERQPELRAAVGEAEEPCTGCSPAARLRFGLHRLRSGRVFDAAGVTRRAGPGRIPPRLRVVGHPAARGVPSAEGRPRRSQPAGAPDELGRPSGWFRHRGRSGPSSSRRRLAELLEPRLRALRRLGSTTGRSVSWTVAGAVLAAPAPAVVSRRARPRRPHARRRSRRCRRRRRGRRSYTSPAEQLPRMYSAAGPTSSR